MKKQLLFILLLSFVMGQTDSLWTEVSGDTVAIHHDNTERNCGVSFDFNVAFLDSNIIIITEVDTGAVAFCNCKFDLELILGGLSTGIWTAEIYGQDLENNGETEYYGSVEFTIDTQGGTGSGVITEYQSACNHSPNYLDYFPLTVGNKWQYEGFEFYMDSTWSTGFVETEVIGDTIMSNGLKYYIIDKIPLFGKTFARIDSSNQILYYYNELYGNEGCGNNEWDFIDYSFLDSVYWIDCLNNQADLKTTELFIESLNDTFPSIVVDHWGSETQTLFSENLGITHVSYSLGTAGAYYELLAAAINGVQYGEFAGVDNEYSYSTTLDKTEYSLGDTMKATFKMKNISNDTINFTAFGWFDWLLIDSLGTVIDGMEFIPIDNYYTINPGDSLTTIWKSPFNTLFWGQLNYGTYYSLMKPFYQYESNAWDTVSFHYVENPNVEDQLEFFPLHIGDMWQYQHSNQDTTFYFTDQIIGDTTMPNGESYFIKNRIGSSYFQYLRIDTLFSVVAEYDSGSCTNDEFALYPLLTYNDSITPWMNCLEYNYNVSFLDSDRLFIEYDWLLYEEFTFTKGLGLTSHFVVEGTSSMTNLNAAIINGVTYGEFVGIDDESPIPNNFTLHQNYPNPFNPTTTIRYELPIQTEVRLTIYNIMGQEVVELVNGKIVAGEHEVIWNAGNLPGGIYFYQLETPGKQLTKKLVVIK